MESTLADLEKEADQLAFDAEKQNKMGLCVSQMPSGQKQRKKTMELGAEKQTVQDLQSKLNDS